MNKRVIKSALLMGIPFGVCMGLFTSWQGGYKTGIIGGIFCGLFFGIAMSIFAEVQRRKMKSKTGLFENEAIVFEGPANHFLKMEGRGGWLTLTPTRLSFRSHGKNIQNAPLDISLSEIGSVTVSRTAGFIPNGLRIIKKDGVTESFVVPGRKEWVKLIIKIANNE
jgi:hypothetical protein